MIFYFSFGYSLGKKDLPAPLRVTRLQEPEDEHLLPSHARDSDDLHLARRRRHGRSSYRANCPRGGHRRLGVDLVRLRQGHLRIKRSVTCVGAADERVGRNEGRGGGGG